MARKFKREEKDYLFKIKRSNGSSSDQARLQIAADEQFQKDMENEKKIKKIVKKEKLSKMKDKFKKGIEKLRGIKRPRKGGKC